MDVTGPPLAGCAGDPCRAAGTAPAGLPGCEAVPGPQSAGPGPARALRPELAETRAKENVVYISCCQVYRLQRDSASAVDWIPVQQSRPELL